MNNKKLRILITGSEGLIGSILSGAFNEKYEIFTLDAKKGKSGPQFICDIADFKKVAEVFRRVSPLDIVIHLAADPRPEASWESVFKNNIVGTRNVYEAAKEASVKRVVFASTNRVTEGYERDYKRKVPPSDPVRPRNYYGVSKVFGEALARMYWEVYGLESICLRIGSVLRKDDPAGDQRHLKTWLSHKDLVDLAEKAILAPVHFGIYYGVSDNKDKIWDIKNAIQDLGYRPQDDASRI